jgi:hypothetical protein
MDMKYIVAIVILIIVLIIYFYKHRESLNTKTKTKSKSKSTNKKSKKLAGKKKKKEDDSDDAAQELYDLIHDDMSKGMTLEEFKTKVSDDLAEETAYIEIKQLYNTNDPDSVKPEDYEKILESLKED